MEEGFFSRWSRRKQEVAATQTPAPDAPAQAGPAPSTQAQRLDSAPDAVPELAPEVAPDAVSAIASDAASDVAPTPVPTLDDVQGLTPASDFQAFMQRGVNPDVRNAAMKKLFADPHFNVMDGLDIYIDDYSQPDPLPGGMLRRMASAQFLQLVPTSEEKSTEERAKETLDEGTPEALLERQLGPGQTSDPVATRPTSEVVAQSPDASAPTPSPLHDHPDLQLQPDPASANPQPGAGAR